MSVSWTSTTAQVERTQAAVAKARRRSAKVAAEEDKRRAEKEELLHLALAVCRIKKSGRRITDAAHKEGLRACGITRVGNVDNVLAGLEARLPPVGKRLESTRAQLIKANKQLAKAMTQYNKAIVLHTKAIMQETEAVKQHFLAIERAQAPQATELDVQEGTRHTEALKQLHLAMERRQTLQATEFDAQGRTRYTEAMTRRANVVKQVLLAMERRQAPQATELNAQQLSEALPAFEVAPGTAQELSERDKEVDAVTAHLRGVEAQPGPLRCHHLEKRTSSGTTSRNVPATRKRGKHAAKSSVSAAKRRRTHTR